MLSEMRVDQLAKLNQQLGPPAIGWASYRHWLFQPDDMYE